MANTYCRALYHIVFSTKNRIAWLESEEYQKRCHGYMEAVARDNKALPIIIGGMADHVHMLISIPPTVSIPAVIKQIKGNSSVWIKENLPECVGFAWQDGYGLFTVSQSQVDVVKEYVLKQREHHRNQTYEEEYRALLRQHKVDFEEKYL